MMENQMNFEFGLLWAFILLPLPIIVYLLAPALTKRRSGLITSFYFRSVKITGIDPTKSSWISKRNILQWIVVCFIWILMVTAMASPQLVGQPESKIKTARSFLVAADISFSMDTKDWVLDGDRLTRWEAVKQVMREFLELRKSDKIGLIFFGTNPYLQAPLTTDLDVIRWMLGETEVGMAGQTTGIGAAIGMGVSVLKEDTLQQKVMLLLTDGVDSGSDIAPLDAAKLAKSDSITIYTIGIGDPEVAGADLDEKTLIDIADATGGQYFRAIDQTQLEKAYIALNELEPVEYEEEEYKPKVLLYFYPLIAALVLAMFYQLFMSVVNFIKLKNS